MSRSPAKKAALAGIMTALASVFMLLGGIIPIATFCCPAIAGVCMLPVMYEDGPKYALIAWICTAIIGMFLCPDKEAALLFLFLGWYPAAKPTFDAIRSKPLRVILKLLTFDIAGAVTLLVLVYVMGLNEALTEYAEMSSVMLGVFVVLANITILLYDRMLAVLGVVYRVKLREKLKQLL